MKFQASGVITTTKNAQGVIFWDVTEEPIMTQNEGYCTQNHALSGTCPKVVKQRLSAPINVLTSSTASQYGRFILHSSRSIVSTMRP